jgi:oligopeptidase B
VPLETIPHVGYSYLFANDSAHLFYAELDDTMRPCRIKLHVVGSDPASDRILLEERDARFYLDLGRTKDKRYIVISSESKNTSECHILAAEPPFEQPVCFRPKREGVQYQIDHGDDGFYMMVSKGGDDPELFKVKDIHTVPEPLRLTGPGEVLENFEISRNLIALQTRINGLPTVSIIDDKGQRLFPRKSTSLESVSLSTNIDYDDPCLRYEVSAFHIPDTLWSYCPGKQESQLLWQRRISDSVDPLTYENMRLEAKAADGTTIPISLVKRRDLELPAPTLIYGYGAYEESIDPSFSVSRLSLLDRGFAFAVAHVRGGGEFGRRWYDAGRRLNKKNSITDLLDATHHLVEQEIADPERICVRGGSAGGLLVAAAINQDPELYRAAVLEVPFVDCLTTISDPSLPLTVTEWDEWGNPLANAEEALAILDWSPYDNLKHGNYPAMLVTTGLNDSRVGFHEPLKYVAKIRLLNPKQLIAIKIDSEAGHLGPSKRVEAWWEEALIISFLLTATAGN